MLEDKILNKIIRYLCSKGIFNHLSDEKFLKLKYWACTGKKLNLSNVNTYNEKLQWLKLYDKNSQHTKMVDKYEVKKIVSNIIGEEYIIPTIGVWNSFDDINFDLLPNSFVLKCTHDSGGIYIVKDKNNIDLTKIKNKIENSYNNNYYKHGREWPYKDVKKRIIAEPYLEDKKYHELRDYKFFVFSGNVKFMFVATNRQGKGETYFDFFDENYNHLNIINGHANAPIIPEKPINFHKMIKLAEKLGKNEPQVRIDFYEINGKVYFGEITYFHWSGFMPFVPNEWDEKIGKYIDLSSIKKEKRHESMYRNSI